MNKKSQPEQSSGVFFKPRNEVSTTAAELRGIQPISSNKKQIFAAILMIAMLLFASCTKESASTSGDEKTKTTEQQNISTQIGVETEEQGLTENAVTEETSADLESTIDVSMTDLQEEAEVQTSADTASSSQISTSTTSLAETTSSSDIDEFTIKAFRYGYEPDTVTVKKGNLVKITIENDDGMHGIKLLAFGVQDMNYVEFTPDKTGTFTWYCNNFCGSGHSSMSGTLIVEE